MANRARDLLRRRRDDWDDTQDESLRDDHDVPRDQVATNKEHLGDSPQIDNRPTVEMPGPDFSDGGASSDGPDFSGGGDSDDQRPTLELPKPDLPPVPGAAPTQKMPTALHETDPGFHQVKASIPMDRSSQRPIPTASDPSAPAVGTPQAKQAQPTPKRANQEGAEDMTLTDLDEAMTAGAISPVPTKPAPTIPTKGKPAMGFAPTQEMDASEMMELLRANEDDTESDLIPQADSNAGRARQLREKRRKQWEETGSAPIEGKASHHDHEDIPHFPDAVTEEGDGVLPFDESSFEDSAGDYEIKSSIPSGVVDLAKLEQLRDEASHAIHPELVQEGGEVDPLEKTFEEPDDEERRDNTGPLFAVILRPGKRVQHDELIEQFAAFFDINVTTARRTIRRGKGILDRDMDEKEARLLEMALKAEGHPIRRVKQVAELEYGEAQPIEYVKKLPDGRLVALTETARLEIDASGLKMIGGGLVKPELDPEEEAEATARGEKIRLLCCDLYGSRSQDHWRMIEAVSVTRDDIPLKLSDEFKSTARMLEEMAPQAFITPTFELMAAGKANPKHRHTDFENYDNYHQWLLWAHLGK